MSAADGVHRALWDHLFGVSGATSAPLSGVRAAMGLPQPLLDVVVSYLLPCGLAFDDDGAADLNHGRKLPRHLQLLSRRLAARSGTDAPTPPLELDASAATDMAWSHCWMMPLAGASDDDRTAVRVWCRDPLELHTLPPHVVVPTETADAAITASSGAGNPITTQQQRRWLVRFRCPLPPSALSSFPGGSSDRTSRNAADGGGPTTTADSWGQPSPRYNVQFTVGLAWPPTGAGTDPSAWSSAGLETSVDASRPDSEGFTAGENDLGADATTDAFGYRAYPGTYRQPYSGPIVSAALVSQLERAPLRAAALASLSLAIVVGSEAAAPSSSAGASAAVTQFELSRGAAARVPRALRAVTYVDPLVTAQTVAAALSRDELDDARATIAKPQSAQLPNMWCHELAVIVTCTATTDLATATTTTTVQWSIPVWGSGRAHRHYEIVNLPPDAAVRGVPFVSVQPGAGLRRGITAASAALDTALVSMAELPCPPPAGSVVHV